MIILNNKNIFSIDKISGNYCSLIPVDLDDAKLIVALRSSRQEFLKKNDISEQSQIDYLLEYQKRYQNKEEIYFKIFDNRLKVDAGVTRITDLNAGSSFGFESGVMFENSTPNLYLDAYFMCLRIGFEYFSKASSGPWIVDNRNFRMLEIHRKIGIAKIINTDDDYVYLSVNKADFEKKIMIYKKMGFGHLGELLND
jgi:hypothetical protein